MKLFILALFTSIGAMGQSVTIYPEQQSSSNHTMRLYSGTESYVLSLRNNHGATGLSFLNNSGYNRGGLVGADDAFTIWHPGGEIFIRNKNTPHQFVKLHTNGNFAVGDIEVPSAGLHVKEYSKLGNDAPAIKMKKFSNTTPATQGSCTFIITNISSKKILDYKTLVSYGIGNNAFVPEEYSLNPNYKFSTYLYDTEVAVCLHDGNSSHLTNKLIKLLVTYEE